MPGTVPGRPHMLGPAPVAGSNPQTPRRQIARRRTWRGPPVSPVMGDAVDRLPGQAEPARGITAPKPGAGRPLWCEGEEMPLAAASSYPLLNLFWTMAEVFLWVMWICVLVMVFMDIFRSHDLSGWAKALWFLFVLVIPLIGVLVYLIARGGSFNERATQRAQRQDEAYLSSYIHPI